MLFIQTQAPEMGNSLNKKPYQLTSWLLYIYGGGRVNKGAEVLRGMMEEDVKWSASLDFVWGVSFPVKSSWNICFTNESLNTFSSSLAEIQRVFV